MDQNLHTKHLLSSGYFAVDEANKIIDNSDTLIRFTNGSSSSIRILGCLRRSRSNWQLFKGRSRAAHNATRTLDAHEAA
jgi:hypothetical protein